ncbi:hypothetical protein [Flavobacterium soli]|uniref:hypothetical protein n=1 Tax=Flavobacterium soli TaxID=344881 RepID=UPI0004039187|nr:hypothetical protein [Flavobacterium soli]
MKKILLILFFALSNSSFAQELFLYEFDETLTLEIPDDAEEGELQDVTFVRGLIDDGYITVTKDKLTTGVVDLKDFNNEAFFEGIKNGVLKKSKGAILKDAIMEIDGVKVLHLTFSLEMEKELKVVEMFAFVKKHSSYLIQLLEFKKDSDTFKTTKERIVNSINIQ